MRPALGFLLTAALFMSGCEAPITEPEETEPTGEKALLAAWDTPFGTPPFDAFKSENYLPALREGMARHQAEIKAITADTEAPTFANTIEELERSGRSLDQVQNVFSAINGANSDEVTRETATEIAPELSAHADDIFLNKDLFVRIKAVHEQREDLDLTPEQMRLLEETYKDFVRAGANLDEPAQDRLRELNGELATLSEQFRNNLLEETNEFELLVTQRADLGNLPPSLVAVAAEEARRRGHECECWVFTLSRPSINPFLEYSPNREMRRKIFTGYAMRGDNGNDADNNDILAREVALRAERAVLLGYESHAHYVLADAMAGTPAQVYELLDQVWGAALAAAGKERDALQAMMREEGLEGSLEGADWRHYTEKVRKARFDLDQDALRPYFEVTAVRDGAFAVATKLFGLTFTPRDDLATWHPDQEVFEVKDADGSHLGILYMDFFARESKRGGAWMNALRSQEKMDGDVTAIVTTNFNFPPPTADSPSLLSFSEAETLFHEFGHALHGMFSDVVYPSLSGTRTPRDYVEFPSQVMENWMSEPEVLKMFARHYETGEVIPQDMVDKITASSRFNQGFITVEYMAAAYLDMKYHTQIPPAELVPHRFEKEVLGQLELIPEILSRYRSTYFQHIFAGGYAAGYYGYLWSEVLDADAFQAFKETSLFDQKTAQAFREHILSTGGTRPGLELYKAFRGREPDIKALLGRRGLLAVAD
ncbi:MAG: M3 family metallopeptidase [Acidobacteria bacterium]|nr:M3 family metallopeptidase [Acidobacteriota bacterium]